MKRVVFCAVFLAVCAVAGPLCLAAEKEGAPDAFTVIHSRKSVRNFTGEAVSKDDLEKIVRAGMAAPTAVNKQPWSFVVISERKALDALSAGLPYAKMLEKAGAAIIVCTSPAEAAGGSAEFAVIDAACASENILLAVEALGLGAVWTAAYPDAATMEHVRNITGIPPQVIPLNVIPIGRPAGGDKPKDKFKPEKVHWEKW